MRFSYEAEEYFRSLGKKIIYTIVAVGIAFAGATIVGGVCAYKSFSADKTTTNKPEIT